MISETLERFREKFKSKTCDCDSICEIHKIEEYEQFIAEEIKLAVEEIVMEVEEILPGEANIHTEFPVGWNNCRREVLNRINKLKKYETIRTI